MNGPVLTYRARPARSQGLEELTSVRLLRAVMTDDGVGVPDGTIGTIVGIWADGAAYEVEFAAGLATVEAADLVAISS